MLDGPVGPISSREELSHRRGLGYPPWGALAQVTISGESLDLTQQAAEQLAEAAEAARQAHPELGVEVLGPAEAPLARLRGRYRVQLLLKAPERAGLLAVLPDIQQRARRLPRDLQAVLDVDPVHML